MNQKHAGKVAVVTGASTGMGQSFALRLANEGADLVLASEDARLMTGQTLMVDGGMYRL